MSADQLNEGYAVVKAARTPEYNRRCAAHEIGHAVTSRAVGSVVELVTIVPDDQHAGRCVRRGASSPSLNLLNEPNVEAATIAQGAPTTADIVAACARIGAPEVGTARVDIAEEVVGAQVQIIELLGAGLCELAMYPDLPPLPAEHDRQEARALASVVCASPAAIDALLSYCSAEAEALICANREIVEVLTDALVEKGTLSGDQVDAIISGCVARRALASEHERRRQWRAVVANARGFKAE